MWSEAYGNMINRNIGILTDDQQKILRNATIALFGLGGLGGVIAEILARSGVGALKIVDNDNIEATNLNRHVFAYRETLGRPKTEVAEEFLKKINPEVRIEKFNTVDEDNIDRILKSASAAVLAIDSVKPCIIISRAARKMDIPLIEGWAIPFGNSRVFTKDSPTLEEVYNMPTKGRAINDVPEEEYKDLKIYMLAGLKKIQGVEDFYTPLAIERIKNGQIPSFAPIVWLTAVLMAFETLKILLKWGKAPLSPHFFLYNPFDNSIPKQEV